MKGKFLGTWKLHRIIQDHRNQSMGQMRGEASFIEVLPTSLDYRESVIHEHLGNKYKAQKEYLYKCEENRVRVYFSENKELFLELNFDTHCKAEAKHMCQEDEYKARYSFEGNDSLTISYEVKGPKKSYSMITKYVRTL